MPRYSLRTLLLIVLVAGPLLAWGWGYVERVIEERRAEQQATADAEQARIAKIDERQKLMRIIGYPRARPLPIDEVDQARGFESLYAKLAAIKSKEVKPEIDKPIGREAVPRD